MKKTNREVIKELKSTPKDNIIIVDFGNVVKWQKSLGWEIGVKNLANFIKNFAYGHKYLRRFYYGSDYGQEGSTLRDWSKTILNKAKYNRFEVITKKVKYIHDPNYEEGFKKKCDFDVEISTDLIRERENYDNIVLFSGDGDFNYLLSYLNKELNKTTYVFGARGHIGKELVDAQGKSVERILFAEDFEKYLNMERTS